MYSFGVLLWRDLSVPVSAPVLEVSLLGRKVVRVAAGGFHCGALSEQGNVYTWGENTAGQCGLTERGTATNITGWTTLDPLPSFLRSFPPTLSTTCLLFSSLSASIHSCNLIDGNFLPPFLSFCMCFFE